MKKHPKKHFFTHPDPERDSPKAERPAAEIQSPALVQSAEPPFVKKDLKKTVLSIGIFILMLAALFLIQTKTGWLSPLLKKFGL